jgi:bifunctional non-homologous end joining protein LigD
VLRYSSHVAGGGAAVFREACRLRLEGIVSKRAADAYRPGRGAGWLKTKCVLRQELVVGGFTEPEGAARDGIGALLVGAHDGAGGPLRFAGKVGTGFTNALARTLRARLDALRVGECPFAPRPAGWLGKNARWVRPVLVCEVEFTEWTADGKVRHPSFQGLREDKEAGEVVREEPSTSTSTTRSRTRTSSRTRSRSDAVFVASVRISSPGRVVYPDLGLTKLDVVRYYDEVAAAILPHLRGRPLTLYHCPEGLAGECRFMKHSKVWAPGAVRRVRIPEKTKVGEYLVVDGEAALLSVAQMDVLELHTWNSTTDRLEEPDRLVLDLDPGPAVRWPEVVRAGREAKILVDYLRNNRTHTSVCAFSSRARPGAPVSVPISWDELGPRLRPGRLTVRTVPRRLRSLREDPWAGYEAARRPLAELRGQSLPGSGLADSSPRR